MYRNMDLSWVIKKLIKKPKKHFIIEGFLSEFLKEDVKITEVLKLNCLKETDYIEGDRIDLKISNAKGEKILVELQFCFTFDYFQRCNISVFAKLIEQLKSYDLSNISKVISINIFYFDNDDEYMHCGSTNFVGLNSKKPINLLNKENLNILFPEFYFIQVDKFKDEVKTTLDEWIYFLKNEKIKEGFTAKGLKDAYLSIYPSVYTEQEHYSNERHLKSILTTNSLTKGKYEFEEIKELSKIVKKMDEEKFTNEQISKITGLDEKEIIQNKK